jgi:hypothetical protein
MNRNQLDLDGFGDPRERRISIWVWVIPVGVCLLVGYNYIVRGEPFIADQRPPLLRQDMDPADELVSKLTETVKGLKVEGPFLSNLVIERGIRAMDGEIPSDGEVKIMVNLAWQSLPQGQDCRHALDRTAARILVEILDSHGDIDKIRLILKIPKQTNKGNRGPLGKALGHASAAKVFSFTRAAFENALAQDPRLYDPNLPEGPASILALGDYVILTDKGWIRGY